MEATIAGRACLDTPIVDALIAGTASAERLKHAAEHLIDTPQAGGCSSCKEQLSARFLEEADSEDPEISAIRAYLGGQLEQAPGPLVELLEREAAQFRHAQPEAVEPDDDRVPDTKSPRSHRLSQSTIWTAPASAPRASSGRARGAMTLRGRHSGP